MIITQKKPIEELLAMLDIPREVLPKVVRKEL